MTLLRVLACLGFVLAACGAPSDRGPAGSSRTSSVLTVFAASSLTEAMTAIAAAFEAPRPGVTVRLNFAGTQTLRAQLEQGAAADVFASANLEHMAALIAAGLVAPDAVQTFASNQLVVILPAGNPGQIDDLADLARPGLKLVLTAPDVPSGSYTRSVLANLSTDPAFGPSYAEAVLANLVSEENAIRRVVTKVQLGEADAGFVFTSDVTPSVAADVITIAIPAEYNVAALYPIAPLIAARESSLAREFVAFVVGSQGQTILQEWGFGTPGR